MFPRENPRQSPFCIKHLWSTELHKNSPMNPYISLIENALAHTPVLGRHPTAFLVH